MIRNHRHIIYAGLGSTFIASILTFFLTVFFFKEFYAHQYALELIKQVKHFTSIQTDIGRLYTEVDSISQTISPLHAVTTRNLAAQLKCINHKIDINKQYFLFLDQVLTKLGQERKYKQGLVMRRKLTQNFNDYKICAQESVNHQEEFSVVYFQTITKLHQWIQESNHRSLASLKYFQNRLGQIRKFLKLPVKIDFDPQPDINYLNKRIKQSKNEIMELNALQEKLNNIGIP